MNSPALTTLEGRWESHSFFSAIVRDLGDAICLHDADLQVRYASPAIMDVLGYDSAERIGACDLDLVHPDDVHVVQQALEAIQKPGNLSGRFEARMRHQSGKWRWIEAVVKNLLDVPEIQAFLSVYRDVSVRKEKEDGLRRSSAETRQQFETLIAASPLSIIAVDRALRVTIWNQASTELFGWKEEEVLGRPLPIYPPAEQPKSFDELRETLLDSDAASIETRRKKRDGTLVEVNIWRAPLHDSSGAISGCMAILMETTERKRLERALLEASEREQRRIGQDLHDELCQQLLGVACMLKALVKGAEADGFRQIGELRSAAKLVNDSVQQARDIARGLHPVQMDAEGLMAALRELADRTTSLVPCQLDCQRPVLIEDRDAAMHCYRIAQEAVTNAVHHAHAGRILIRLRENPDAFILQVVDDGIGLRPDEKCRPKAMGLDIMNYRAHAIGGRLRIEPRGSGDGLSVTCTIPKTSP